MLKKLFEWTPRDVADWEKIRSRGLRRFVLHYGMLLFGGILFVLLGGAVILFALDKTHVASLLPQLVVIALICAAGGLLNSLLTWTVEERMYRKYKQKYMEMVSNEPRTEN